MSCNVFFMERRKINKNLLILLLVVAIFIIIYFYSKSMEPVIFVTDTQYYETTVKKQKFKLEYLALKNKEKLEFKFVEVLQKPIQTLIDDDSALVIMSPLVAYSYKEGTSVIDNEIISIGYESNNKNVINALLDENNDGWIAVANKLKKQNLPLYIISDKSWPLSEKRAEDFITEYGNAGLTHIDLDGDELKQFALSKIKKIKSEGINKIVFTGSTLLSEFVASDDTFLYTIPENLDETVKRNQIDNIVYTDLSPLFDEQQRESGQISLNQGVWDYQAGLKNSLIQFWKALESKLY